MKYNRGDINDTMSIAIMAAKRDNIPYYIEATAYGLLITKFKPPMWSAYFVINPDGKVSKHTGGSIK